MGFATEVTSKLKIEMKKQGLRYQDLAKSMGLSEATLKRCFSREIFTLNRLEKICDVLGMTLENLGKSSEEPFQVEFLSENQEVELAKDESLFVVFYLIIAGLEMRNISKFYKLDEKTVEAKVLKLDKLKLIKLFPKDRIVTCVNQNVWWAVGGALSKKYHNLIQSDFMKSAFQGKYEGAWIVAGNFSAASIETMRKKIDKLSVEFKELMSLDGALPLKDKVNITFVAAHRPWVLPPILKYKR